MCSVNTSLMEEQEVRVSSESVLGKPDDLQLLWQEKIRPGTLSKLEQMGLHSFEQLSKATFDPLKTKELTEKILTRARAPLNKLLKELGFTGRLLSAKEVRDLASQELTLGEVSETESHEMLEQVSEELERAVIRFQELDQLQKLLELEELGTGLVTTSLMPADVLRFLTLTIRAELGRLRALVRDDIVNTMGNALRTKQETGTLRLDRAELEEAILSVLTSPGFLGKVIESILSVFVKADRG